MYSFEYLLHGKGDVLDVSPRVASDIAHFCVWVLFFG